jgi:hypothetical protein
MPAFERRTLTIAPGSARPAAEADWSDALVLVSSGAVEVVCAGGSTRRFVRGDLIWLRGVPLQALRNDGACDAVLVAVSRGA